MTFFNYIFLPKLFKEYGEGFSQSYETKGVERWGDQIISTLSMFWSISYYTSPLILTFLYRRGYFVVDSIATLAKLSTGIGILVALSLCMRGIGRSQSQNYRRFARAYSIAKNKPKDADALVQLKAFDFDFKYWPVDYDAGESKSGIRHREPIRPNTTDSARRKPIWVSTLPCEVLAYIAIHTFGLRMIYPGSLKIIQSYLQPMLLQGRAKLIEEENAVRYKIRTCDNNDIDTVFVDNRNKSQNGKTLVICSEGNAGFYEIGIMVTPLEKKYSVIGWNHPGFAGSSGTPFPDQDQNAIDAVMQFAIQKLGFTPDNIIPFGWSIGAYSTLYLASQYPDIKGVILDATFDDILPLAIPKMPESLSGIVKIAIRSYVNLNNSELLTQYNGPILMIRRTEDEIITIEEMNLTTNRGNHLLLAMLKVRFPIIFGTEQLIYINKLLSKSLERNGHGIDTDQQCFTLLTSYITDNNKNYPLEIGEDYTTAQKNQMAEFLVRKHMADYKSSHCTPLPAEYFQIPWDLLNENDFIFY